MKYLFAMCVIGLWIPLCSAQERDATDNAKIERLILELGSTSYSQRQKARIALEGYHKSAIPALLKTVDIDDAELSFAAVEILQAIATNSDLETLERVLTASDKLSPAIRHRFSRWSSEAVDQWKSTQSERSLSELTKLGAVTSKQQVLNGIDFLFLDESANTVAEIKNSAPDIKNALAEIKTLKDLRAGNLGKKPNQKHDTNEAASNDGLTVNGSIKMPDQIVVVDGVRLVVDRRGRLIRAGDPSAGSKSGQGPPKNITIGKNWRGDAEDLSKLRMVFNLGQLEFVEKKITKDYLDAVLRVSSVSSILFTRCTYSFNEVRDFKAKLNGRRTVQIMATGIGYLGVYGPSGGEPTDGTGSYVSMVSPKSAASEASIERGDVIFKVDDDNIDSFAELSLAISSKSVGKPVRLMIRHGDDEKEVIVNLKSRDNIIP